MIYLFCNKSFGPPFEEAADAYARRTGAAITIVHARPAGPGGPFAFVRGALDRLGRPPRLVVADVNAPEFWERLSPGDTGVIAGFNQIFRSQAIERLDPFVNFHASLLPYYRGPAPAYWCIANGERATGFTLHRVTANIDAGEILYQEAVPIDPVIDTLGLTRKIARLAARMLAPWLDHVRTGSAWRAARVDAGSLYLTHAGYASFPPRQAGAGK